MTNTIDAIRAAVTARDNGSATHWDGCAVEPRHRDCAIVFLLDEIDRLREVIADHRCMAPPEDIAVFPVATWTDEAMANLKAGRAAGEPCELATCRRTCRQLWPQDRAGWCEGCQSTP